MSDPFFNYNYCEGQAGPINGDLDFCLNAIQTAGLTCFEGQGTCYADEQCTVFQVGLLARRAEALLRMLVMVVVTMTMMMMRMMMVMMTMTTTMTMTIMAKKRTPYQPSIPADDGLVMCSNCDAFPALKESASTPAPACASSDASSTGSADWTWGCDASRTPTSTSSIASFLESTSPRR